MHDPLRPYLLSSCTVTMNAIPMVDDSAVDEGSEAGRIATTDPGDYLPRVKQVRWDHYYMEIALAVRKRANCLGARIGAVLVVDNRVVSTGFNGTPAGFPNCLKGGCVRCLDRYYGEIGHPEWASDAALAEAATKQLDLCICVHAEANAMLTAARLGHRIEGSTLYATHKPCFMCLKEGVQAGVGRIVYLKNYKPTDSPSLLRQYEELAEFLRENDQRNFEQLHAQAGLLEAASTEIMEPNLDDWLTSDGPSDEPIVVDLPLPEVTITTVAKTSRPKRTKSRARAGTTKVSRPAKAAGPEKSSGR
jgi:dCMP deaminase